MRRSIPFLWALVIISLIMNLFLLGALNLARLTALESLSKIEATLDNLANEVIVYDVEVNQTVPVKADVPINRTMEIPLNTVIPINQELSVPFQTPAGQVVLNVPVKTDFPIDIVVPVEFNDTITIDTAVELNTTLPVVIDIAKTPLATYLQQTKADIAQLRSRLSLKGRVTAEKGSTEGTLPSAGPNSASAPVATGESESPALEAETATSVSGPGSQSDRGAISSATTADFTLLLNGEKLGQCAHPYWPLWPGTAWTYNSQDTSYTQSVGDISNNRMLLSTQYEDRAVQSNLVCSQEGLGGDYLGDMRRISELGDFSFSNLRGVFLPRPEAMEEMAKPWMQEMEVTGTVQASQGDSLVEGQIIRGRATAVYTPTGFETVETPLGPQEALRVEQRLEFELEIVYNVAGKTVPATETINLSTIYWFVRNLGLAKMHWLGGTIQHAVQIGQTPLKQISPVPTLAQDLLALVCVTPTDQPAQCAPDGGAASLNLTAPSQSELVVPGFIFPSNASTERSSSAVETAGAMTPEAPQSDGDDDSGRSDLLAYAGALDSLGGQLSKEAEEFWGAVLKYQSGQLTFDEFRAEFQEFAPKLEGLVGQIYQLSPPPQAEAIHAKLTRGLAKCDQAIDLMAEWFDAPDSGTKDAGALLVAGCAEEVASAGDELMDLVGGN